MILKVFHFLIIQSCIDFVIDFNSLKFTNHYVFKLVLINLKDVFIIIIYLN
jgi:hypothetical protein